MQLLHIRIYTIPCFSSTSQHQRNKMFLKGTFHSVLILLAVSLARGVRTSEKLQSCCAQLERISSQKML